MMQRTGWLLAALLVVSPSICQAQKAATTQPKPAEKIPDGPPKAILEYMEQALTLNPEDDSPEAIQAAFKKTIENVIAASKKVMAHPQSTAEQKETAQQFHIDLLFQGSQAGLEGMLPRLKALAEELTKADPKGELAALAHYRAIAAEHGDEIGLNGDALPVVEDFIAKFPKNIAAVMLLEEIIQSCEWSVKPELGAKACDLIVKHFPDQAAEMRIEGVKRRLVSAGKPFQLTGTTLDGKPFDLKKLEGKVVLVDFWATWCGPCLAEMPNLKKAYEKYKDKGFEIVGVSLDDEKENLDEFLQENKLPWMQVYEPKKENRGFDNPNVARYGISGIPTMILLDQKGRVVSTTVVGPILETLLEDVLARESKPAAN